MKYIVTHPKPAHRDDLMSVCSALFIEGAVPVLRREPTEEELNDPEVLVLDVGGRHEPELNNFDHHQLPREHEPECALSLYYKARGLHEVMALRKWYRTTVLIDSKGPYEAARVLGLNRFPFELSSPVEAAILERFENAEVISGEMDLAGLALIGQSCIEYAKRAKSEFDEAASSVTVLDVKGVQALLWHCKTPEQTQAVRDELYPEAGIALSHDERGAGWSLYRFNDCAEVDFSKLEGDPTVLFAHKGGFVAKTHQLVPLALVLKLTERAIVEQYW